MANAGTMKWIMDADGDLSLVPKYVDGVEIKHTVPTRGGDVLAAGEADIVVHNGKAIATNVNRHSGHYEPDEPSLDRAVEAMRQSGIIVDDSVVDRSKYPAPPTHS